MHQVIYDVQCNKRNVKKGQYHSCLLMLTAASLYQKLIDSD